MEVTIEDIKKLRTLTGAGLGDCKKALAEANGDMDTAVEIIRKRGQAIAAKRSDREASNGCVLVKAVEGFGAMIALKCETDFVAANKDFVALTQSILDLAVANKCKSLEEVEALHLNDKGTVKDAVTNQSGITGEKMELDGYFVLEGEHIYTYNHQAKNILCTMVQLNKAAEEQGHALTMQIAAMNPVSVDKDDVREEIRAEEFKIAIEKTREEGKPENLVERIAEGRMNAFYKEATLLNQDFIQDSKITVRQYLQQADKDLTAVAFCRFTLRAE